MSDATQVKHGVRGKLGVANPFPGLRPFDQKDASLFFGRTEQQSELIERLAKNRFLAVIGVSGSGKSSLVRAGLIPRINKGYLNSWTNWRIARLRPGDQPVAFLANALVGPLRETVLGAEKLKQLFRERGEKALLDLVNVDLPADCRLLIFVDQFEELFRFKDRDERILNRRRAVDDAADFVRLMLTALDHPRIYAVITMRSDYLGDCAQFRGLPEQINKGQYLIPRLTDDEQREIIQKPVWACKADISDDLVERLIRDVGSEPQQLPILQHVLMRIWKRWEERRRDANHEGNSELNRTDYTYVGGFQGALNQHADEIYRELGSEEHNGSLEHQWIAQRLFRRITIKDRSDRVARRPVKLQDIYEITGAVDDQRKTMVQAVIARYQKDDCNFLAPFSEHGNLKDDERMVDISHESLCDLWKELKKWVDDEAESADRYRMISEQAELYARKDRGPCDPGELNYVLRTYHPLESDRDGWTKAWSKRYNNPDKDVDEYDRVLNYLRESDDHYAVVEKKRYEDEARIQKAEAERKYRVPLAALGGLLLIAVLLVIVLLYNRQQRTKEQLADVSVQAAQRSNNPLEALPLLAQALDNDPHSRTAMAMVADLFNYGYYSTRILRHEDAVTSAAFSPDGSLVVTASADGTAQIWNVETGINFGTMKHNGPVTYAEFSSNGLIVTASEDGKARLWSVPSKPVGKMKEIRVLTPTACAAAGVEGGGTRSSVPVNKARFGRDGSLVVTAWGGGTAQVWNANTGGHIACLEHAGSVLDAVFDDGGNRVVTASIDGMAQVLLDVASCMAPSGNCPKLPLSEGPAPLDAARFNPVNKDMIAVASYDGTAKIRNIATQEKHDLTTVDPGTPPAPVSVVQFSPDGKWLIVASEAGRAWVWDTASYQKYPISAGDNGKLPAHQGAIYDVEFDREAKQSKSSGPRFLTASADGTAQVWSISCAEPASCEGIAPDKVVHAEGPRRSHRHAVYTAAFNGDGKRVVTASADHTARLWYTTRNPTETSPGNAPRGDLAFKSDEHILSADLTRDGKIMAIALKDGKVEVRNADSSKRLWIHQDVVPVNRVHFSLDGRWIAATANDNTIQIWDAATGRVLVTPFRLDDNSGEGTRKLKTAVFSRDGGRLAAASDNGTVEVWKVSGGRLFDLMRLFPPSDWIYDKLRGSPQLQLTREALFKHSPSIVALEFDPEGDLLLTISIDGKARLLDRSKGETKRTFPHSEPVNSATFSPDGKWILTSSVDNTARIWTKDGNPVAALTHTLPVLDAAFSGDGRLIVTGSFGQLEGPGQKEVAAEIRIWDSSSGLPLGPPLTLKGETPSWVRFRQDNTCVMSAGVPLQFPGPQPPPDGKVWDRQVQLSNPGGAGELKDLLQTVSGYTVIHGVIVPPQTKLRDILEIAKGKDPNASGLAGLLLQPGQPTGARTVCAPSPSR